MPLTEEQRRMMYLTVREHEQQRIEDKIRKACKLDINSNVMVRGYVTEVTCRCGATRWNDGTRCPTCDRYYSAMLNLEDEGRIG